MILLPFAGKELSKSPQRHTHTYFPSVASIIPQTYHIPTKREKPYPQSEPKMGDGDPSEKAKADQIQLPYTIQTSVGMVLNQGLPADLYTLRGENYRNETRHRDVLEHRHATAKLPSIRNFEDYAGVDWFGPEHAGIPEKVIACIRTGLRPNPDHIEVVAARDVWRYFDNIEACRNRTMDTTQLASFMRSRTRLRLEQAAGAIVSAFVNAERQEEAYALIRELTGVLSVSAMRVPAQDSLLKRNTLAQGATESFTGFTEKVYFWCNRAIVNWRLYGENGDNTLTEVLMPPIDYPSLVRLLLRVRSPRPTTLNRCLYIPAWLFAAAEIDPPGGHSWFLNEYQAGLEKDGRLEEATKGYTWPQNEPADSYDGKVLGSIVLSKHGFRILQRGIFHLFPFWDPAVCLRRKVHALEDTVLYGGSHINQRLAGTDDVARVAFWFFGFQRRLQPKIVSDSKWIRFLAGGEGSKLYQNNICIKSTFEHTLARIAGLDVDLLNGPKDDEIMDMIDNTSLLMKEYVTVYGGGRKESLVFTRGQTGGTGRGSVDEYNMLCDILRDLTLRAEKQGVQDVPGPVYKFLANDIMHWNNDWSKDAFAGEKVHGWEDWIRKRNL
ncbi:hypothetical protein GQ53DRAFT_754064, partial [Thozetella sp. PMI_491]